MDNYALKQQLVGELKETLRIKQLNLELMDSMESTILFLIKGTDKEIPNIRHLDSLLRRVRILYDELYPTKPTENLHKEDQSETGQSLITLSF